MRTDSRQRQDGEDEPVSTFRTCTVTWSNSVFASVAIVVIGIAAADVCDEFRFAGGKAWQGKSIRMALLLSEKETGCVDNSPGSLSLQSNTPSIPSLLLALRLTAATQRSRRTQNRHSSQRVSMARRPNERGEINDRMGKFQRRKRWRKGRKRKGERGETRRGVGRGAEAKTINPALPLPLSTRRGC